jgi:hypothetical protein
MKQQALIVLCVLAMFGCVVDKSAVSISGKKKTTTTASQINSASVSSVQIINNQLVITGTGLTVVSNIKVNGHSLDKNFNIESQSATQIIANSLSAFSFDVSKVFNLILSDAYASATFPIDFSLCNSTLNGKSFNCAITPTDKDVLSYDAVSGMWKPRAATGTNYLGAFNASANPPAPTPVPFPASGSYYIVSADGMIGATSFVVGDWLISNGTAWQKIGNSTLVTSVFSRTGNIVAQEGDYNLDQLTDVDLSVAPVSGKILKFNGTHWVAADDLSGGGAGSVVTSSIADSAVTDAKIVSIAGSKITGTINSSQILDGTIVNTDINAAAAIDYSKLNIPAAAIPYAKLNVANGDITYAKLSIANGDIPAAKISGLPASTAVLTTSITNGDTTHAPDADAVFDALGLKLNLTGGTLSVGTINGVPTPLNLDDVVNKQYADTNDALKVAKAGDTMSGVLTLDNDLKIKGATFYVTVKGSASTAANYNFTLPINGGTNGYVLATNGSGVTSWIAATDSSVQAFAKAVLPTCGAGEVLKSNGTAFSCVTDSAGGGAFSGTASRAIATSGAGALEVSATTAAELGFVSGVTSAIQTQINAKEPAITATTLAADYYAGDKTFRTLNTAAVAELTNLYFTDTRARSAVLATTIVNADALHAPDGNAVYDALLTKLNLIGGGTISLGTINGVPTPVNGDDVANKSYVDTTISDSSGVGGLLPASSIVAMAACPAAWTDIGATAAAGPSQAYCNGASCRVCQSPAATSLIPASSIMLMDTCPYTWTSLGAAAGSPSVVIAGINYVSCQSPATSTRIPQNAKILMKSCPTSWNDIGTGSGPGSASCTGTVCHACEAPGNNSLIRSLTANSGGTVNYGGNISITAGAGGTTSGDAGDVNINSGTTTGSGAVGKILMNSANAGRVGIGTTTPTSKLHVNTTTDDYLTFETIGVDSNPTNYVVKYVVKPFDSFENVNGYDVTRYGLEFKMDSVDAGLNPLTGMYSFDGNVGIGTKPGVALLTVNAFNPAVPIAPSGSIVHIVGSDGSSTAMTIDTFGNTPKLIFRRSAGQASAPTAVTNNTILGTIIAHGYGSSGYGFSGSTGIDFFAAETWTDTANGSKINFSTTPIGSNVRTNQMTILDNGNVGIGLAVPNYKLDVVGGVNASGGFTSVSDRRLKKNIFTIDNALEKILGLRGVEFDWKSNDEHEIGLIAQEVEAIEPTFVKTGANGFKAVKYSNIVALLIEAMKKEHKQVQKNLSMMKTMQSTLEEHGRKIASLEEENIHLKKENADIKIRLNRLEKAILQMKH